MALKAAPKLGALPEWNLDDLYPGIDSPQIGRDLAQADADCVAFERDFKGRLAAMAAGARGGQELAEAVKRYEAIGETFGRLGSYAGLMRSGDVDDPTIAKFAGDVQERITAASIHLLFFELELNRIASMFAGTDLSPPSIAAGGSLQQVLLSAGGTYLAYVLVRRVERPRERLEHRSGGPR